MSVKLAENATLADAMPLLHDPVAYLLRVNPSWHNARPNMGMHRCA